MGWLERLPASVKWIAFFGGFLLTAFASKLPEGLQDAGAYIGLALVVVAVVAAGLHWLKELRGGDKVQAIDLIRLGLGGVVIFALIAGAGYIWFRGQTGSHKTENVTPNNASADKKPWKHSLEDLYNKDFNLLAIGKTLDGVVSDPARKLEPTAVHVTFRVYQDFQMGSEFVSVFIPLSKDARINDKIPFLIKDLRDHVRGTRDELHNSMDTKTKTPGQPLIDSKSLQFLGRVFVYTDEPMSIVQLGELISWYQAAGLSLEVRGYDYWWANRDR